MSQVAELSDQKRTLLDRYLRGNFTGRTAKSAPINRRPPATTSRLSWAQEQVWLHAQMASEIPFYNETMTVYRSGPLDVGLLKRCMGEIVRRHEIWRTTFDIVDGNIAQVIHPTASDFPLRVIDFRSLRESERESQARLVATEDAGRPFDLKNGPLVRALLVQTGDESYRLYVTLHQIIFDAVTAYRIFLRELTALYTAFAAGKASPLPELNIQYADFAYWERHTHYISSEQMNYWRDQLASEVPVLQWPNQRLRPPIETHRGEIRRFTFPASLVQGVKEASQSAGVSLYMTLLSGLATILYRYTGQENIVLGGFTAGRNRPELDPLMGYFVNPLALRINISGNPTFRELQTRVRQVVLEGLAHAEVPFAEVVKQTQLHTDPSRNPLFQIVLSQQPSIPPLPSGWDLRTEEISNGGSKLDLVIVIDERKDEISGPITFNPDVVDADTVDRLIAHWKNLLTSMSRHPDQHIAQAPILTGSEQKQILIDWNNTATDYPEDACLHELIGEQARRTPTAVAVVHEGYQLSYKELNSRSNQLARYLLRLSIIPGASVGICMDRSPEMLVALLATLKAGAAYVPLDPGYPAERLTFMVKDSGLNVVLTKHGVSKDLPSNAARVVCLDREWPLIACENSDDVPRKAVSTDLAYVIYTSGSTGQPKGVQISHRALVNFLSSVRHRPGLTPSDVVLAVTTISFDIAALELYLPLIVGARCVLASKTVASDGRELEKMLEACAVTAMQATPSTWKLLIEAGWRGKPDLKALCGGEPMSMELAAQLIPRVASVWNMYGPTETTVWSAVYQVTSPDEPIPVGRPIGNTKIYVLDKNMQPVPIGISGELYIGGDGLARGYLKKPELTAEKFIADPFGKSGERLYRTGDLARYRPDGNIECLGRTDGQVKIRGFRIELGEIESVLRSHPSVADACAIAREDVPGDRRLVAYFVPAKDRDADINGLRGFLKEKLPSYMVPSLVELERLPLMPNGKLNRHLLPIPNGNGSKHEASIDEVQDPVEQVIARIWCDVLNVERVDKYENFFDLGGHSLLATQVVAKLENELGVRIKARELAFQALGQLAASCKQRLTYQ
jgi:amino acid adenylation domain-containing protein